MSRKELKRIEVMAEVSNKLISMGEAAGRLELSKRQLRRLWGRYKKEGGSGLAHRSRGRASGRSLSKESLEKVCHLLRTDYVEFGPTLAAEYLKERNEIKISREKVRQIQIAEKLWKPKKRKEGRCHPRRKRRSRVGALIQIDGSNHEWLDDRGPRLTLIAMIDDATSRVMMAEFVVEETTLDYMSLTKKYIEKYGLPQSFYLDQHGIFRINQGDGEARGEQTQFGRALKELGIELICATTPQAKGRVERLFETFQDRLVKAMRLAKVSEADGANQFLESYLLQHNGRFAVEPAEKEEAHRPLNGKVDLNRVFSIQESRKLSKELSFSYNKRLYQVDPEEGVNRLRYKPIQVLETLNGCLLIESLEGKLLKFGLSGCYPSSQEKLDSQGLELLASKGRKVGRHHPWRGRAL